ncbi:TlpA family protein disulfide reductase [Flavobacteriaceae bacterium TP-CH-4]|uniref:TlpA family protein disulfide reductase n=1 Tax=Pelagihabitans pacificus TaxID=2696054 RepID=A0A967AZ88_9FLAO|nr:TlpA disulfide reductase family protein [Pelagihabitans pacificus]NHF59261.1 TlpA family protein disulfide reductase [Pelagihabitans pacificus]
MWKLWLSLLLTVGLIGCQQSAPVKLSEGIWRAELMVMDNQVLPFNFQLIQTGSGDYAMEIYNAEEVINVDEIETNGDSILFKTPVFEGFVRGKFTENRIEGEFIKESLDRIVPFTAVYGEAARFDITHSATEDINGIWETEFSPNTEERYMGKGIFTQKGDLVTGTFRTTTGDYRFLEGVMDGDSLRLSAFDGAHAFLFTAKATDSTLIGTFYSGNHFKEPFEGKRNEAYELPSADSLTFLKEGYDRLDFRFPDTEGKLVSLSDQRFKEKVVLVQIMGTWCPNCLDETKFYVDYLKNNPSDDLQVIALAFEYARTKEGAFNSIQRLKDRIGVNYPIVLAQYGTSDKGKAQEKLPMLNHVLSYPTTIFIDKKGTVRKIHTGFNGPATGDKYIEFQNEFDSFVRKLLAE